MYGMTNRLENIGPMIRNERLRKGLTQEELGERVGVGKAQISKIESGKGLTIKTVTRVLDALGMSASVVLKNEQKIDKNVIAYIVSAISEFCRKVTIFLFVRRVIYFDTLLKGIDFYYRALRCRTFYSHFDDCVQDLYTSFV